MAHTFHYGARIERCLYQFLRIFAGFQIQYGVDRDNDGQKDMRTVPVYYGDMSRLVSAILKKHETFSAARLPIMTGVLTSIEPFPEARLSRFHQEHIARVREVDGKRVVNSKLMGTPLNILIDLSILTSNNQQMIQLLEQIIILFNPRLSIQLSENLIDWGAISEVELLSVASEANVPAGVDERTIIFTLSFQCLIWLDFPQIERENVIDEIVTSIKDNTNQSDGITLDSFVIDENTPEE